MMKLFILLVTVSSLRSGPLTGPAEDGGKDDTQDDHHLHTVAGDLDQFLDVIQKHPKDVRLKKVK